MVQRRTARGPAAASTKSNPFDSDDESPPKPAYKNPFDEDLPKKVDYSNPFDDSPPMGAKAAKADAKNPFDDESMWSKRNESSGKRNSPAAETKPEAEKVDRPRRRDVVKEKLTAVSDDLKATASHVRPRSRNLMGGGSSESHQRQQLLEGGRPSDHRGQLDGHSRARIDQAFKSGESLDGESVQQLEDYAVNKAEETTAATYKALKLAEDIKESATNTSIMLHEQGHQITRAHETAAGIDVQLSRGEKLLGSLGGLFSTTWKPKKTRNITGPMLTRGDSFKRKAYGMEQRAALGLNKSTSPRGRNRTSSAAVADSSGSQFQSRVKNEFDKQDEALSDLSNVLDQLKEMTIDMGTEIGRQTQALDHVEDDVVTLDERVRGANERTRRLLGK